MQWSFGRNCQRQVQFFQTTIDSEVIAYHVARERLNVSKAEDAVKNAMKKIKGAMRW